MKVPGVTDVEVDLTQKQAVVIGVANRSLLAKVVEDAGYKVLNNYL